MLQSSGYGLSGYQLVNVRHSHLAHLRALTLGGRSQGCLSHSSTESGSGTPLVSGNSRQKAQPMIGPQLYTSMAANEMVPFGFAGTRELTRQPTRKLKLTRDRQRCLEYSNAVNGT